MTPWGYRLPDRPYFPLYLGNGQDAMLINLLGSGFAWFEASMDYGAPLSGQKAAGWFKCDRRTHTGLDLVYGILVPLFEFTSAPVLRGDLIVPRDSRQYFDPRSATLTTFYEQVDNETLEWLHVKVTTFLTFDHVLVEHYEFLKSPRAGVSIRFLLNSPSEDYLHLHPPAVKLDRATLRAVPSQSSLVYDFSFERFRGGAHSWCDCECEAGKASKRDRDGFVHGYVQTRAFRRGESFTRYLVALDNIDARRYRQALQETVDHCRASGYRRLHAQHQQAWARYFNTCHIDLPDPAVAFAYDVSRYFLRANLDPSGFLPMGNLPYLWQGVQFWDAGFGVQAFLGCGNRTEAARVLTHLTTYRQAGRALARNHRARGMQLEWTVERDQITPYPFLTRQVHNNAWWAHLIYHYASTTADGTFLRRHLPLMEELLLFLVDAFLEDRGDHIIVRRCEGVDESVANEKLNDTWTCAVTLRALLDYRAAIRQLQGPPRIAHLDDVIRKLAAGLDRNVDAHGVLQSFHGGRLPHWGSLVFDLFPNHPARRRTLRKMLENCDPVRRLYNLHGVTRYAEKTFPWGTLWAARCFSRGAEPQAYRLLVSALADANLFGGLPERLFYYGERFNNWFLTAHAALVWAVNGMLAHADGNVLRVLNGIPNAWHALTFAGLHAGQGLVVDAKVQNGQLRQLDISNLNRTPRDVQLCVRGTPHGTYRLRRGLNRIRL